MAISINITGGTYQHKSLPVSAQITKNFWPQVVDDPIVKDKYILENFVGQTLFGTASGVGRGMFKHQGLLYRVCGNTLYSVISDGTHTTLGTIPGTEQCIFDGIGSDVIVIGDRRAFIWNGSTLTEVTDVDLQSPDSVTVLNNQAIYDGEGGQFGVSDVGDASSINGLNYATAESKADNLIRVYAFDEIVYMFGEETIEQWWNSGVGNPPFDKVQGGIIQRGLAGLYAVSSNEKFVYFLGDDREVYRLKGSAKEAVTNQALVREFKSYTSVSDAIIWCMKLRGQNFTVVTFPTDDKTWIYPEGGQWFQWSSGVSGGRNKANSYVNIYNKDLVEDYANGNIYEIDFDTYAESGSTIIRQRDTALLDGELFGFPNKKIEWNKITLNIEKGVGLLSGQGSDPKVMLAISDDGGRTFKELSMGRIGKLGEFQLVSEWNALGSSYARILRFTTSDPVSYTIKNIQVEIGVGA